VRGRGDSSLKLLGVTVLTNLGPADLIQQGVDHPPAQLVLHRAMLAKEAGFDGVVASGLEAAAIRETSGTGFLIVTPGIRPSGGATQDQTRVVTPAMAIEAGADYLVVGRPITAAQDPRKAAEAIAKEIDSALS
jgi:orotidine-5'-phosphate decarboxylase